MKISVTVTFEAQETDLHARVLAYLREMNIDSSEGDADGRRWTQITGRVDEAALLSIMAEISK